MHIRSSSRAVRSIWAASLMLSVIAAAPILATEENEILRGSDSVQNDAFGTSMDLDGSLMVVGAPSADVDSMATRGAVYVYEDDGNGNWTEIEKIVAPDGLEFDSFGKAVAVSGDTLVVGAVGVDVGTNVSEGAAYIFRRDSGGVDNWGMVQKLTASTNVQALADYGAAVDIDGDTVVIGARTAYSQAHGGVFIYERNEGGTDNWGETQNLVDDVFDSNASFGCSVAIDGDVLVVGAENLDLVLGTFENEGGIYIFTRNAGTWTQSAKIFASDADGSSVFGDEVAIDGDRILVGSAFRDENGLFSVGKGYIIEKTGPADADWTETDSLSLDTPVQFAYFSRSIALLGDTAVTGATGLDGIGKAFVYEYDGANWVAGDTLTPSDGVSGDSFAFTAAISPSVILLGSPYGDEGAAYRFERSGGGFSGPGTIPNAGLRLDKTLNVNNVALSWGASCSTSGVDYAVYEGELGNWYSHTSVTCSDTSGDLTEEIATAAGDRYYLVVPLVTAAGEEGGYGTDDNGTPRARGFSVCEVAQDAATCP